MRNLLAFLGAVVLTVGGLGWYLGWYHVQTTPAPQGHRGVKIDFDTTKIGADIQRGGQKLQGLVDKTGKDSGTPAKARDASKEKSSATPSFGGSEEAER